MKDCISDLDELYSQYKLSDSDNGSNGMFVEELSSKKRALRLEGYSNSITKDLDESFSSSLLESGQCWAD